LFDVVKVREDFPILKRRINGRNIIYFDNAATTHKPIQVINAISDFYRNHNANVHRGFHTLSQEASELFEEAHDVVARFINAYSWDEVIQVSNTTEGINLVAYTWGLRNVKEGDEIILTVMDHHSNMLPWRKLAQLVKAKIKYVDITDAGLLNYGQLNELITERTKVVAFPMMSNVLGTINDVKKIVNLAHSVGAVAVADGAQWVPHLPTNVRELGIDFLAFSGHKMLGPTGVGILWGRKDLLEDLEPFKCGGETIKDVTLDGVVWHDLPWRFEAGTPNIAGMIGLGEAVRYLERIGMENILSHERSLVSYTMKRLNELEENVEIYGPRDISVRGGIISFNVKGLHHHTVGKALDIFGIAVRTGGHCAHPLHYRLGINGTVRASYYLYNTLEEIDEFVRALRTIISLRDKLAKEPVEEVCTGG